MSGASETADNPTIGLLQIRFSSTVHDFAAQGPQDRLACVGCTFPSTFATHASESGDSDFWAVSGPTQNLTLMESVACNVGMGAWYYYTYATGNGNPSKVTYLAQYCAGQGRPRISSRGCARTSRPPRQCVCHMSRYRAHTSDSTPTTTSRPSKAVRPDVHVTARTLALSRLWPPFQGDLRASSTWALLPAMSRAGSSDHFRPLGLGPRHFSFVGPIER